MNDETLAELGAAAARAQDAALASRPLPPLVLQRPAPRPVWVPLAAAGALAAAAVLLWLRPLAGPEGAANAGVTTTLPPWVHPQPGARVASPGTPALVQLEAGALLLSGAPLGVVPGDTSRLLEVGPWRVEPQAAAQAAVRWDPAELALTVEVSAGEVQVRGPGLGGVRTLRAGERLALSPREPAEAASASSSGPPAAEAAAAAVVRRGVAVAAGAEAPLAVPADVPADVPPDAGVVAEPAPAEQPAATWQELARANLHTQALAAARREGVESILASAPAAELQLLGDSARFGLDVQLAASSFEAMRRRFAGTLEGARASFYLARIESDARRDDARAAALLREYLEGAPDDVLRQEASGRLVEALSRSGRRREATDAAGAYLARWPEGPHAELCRSMGGAAR